ncbi:MAG: PDZ domain-containing protein, partial [Hyphomicrobiaceae bacterium]
MRGAIRLLVATLLLLFAGPFLAPALAQDNKGWLGVETQDVTKAESDQLGWDSPHGAKVTKAPAPGSPAEKAGIRNGDIILAIDRTVIDNSADVDVYLAGKQPGTELRLQVLSAGRERRVTATLATRPAQQVATQVIDSND